MKIRQLMGRLICIGRRLHMIQPLFKFLINTFKTKFVGGMEAPLRQNVNKLSIISGRKVRLGLLITDKKLELWCS